MFYYFKDKDRLLEVKLEFKGHNCMFNSYKMELYSECYSDNRKKQGSLLIQVQLQNGGCNFCITQRIISTNNLSLHKKTNIIKKMTKTRFVIALIFYHRKVVKQDHYMARLLIYTNTVL